MAIISSSFCPDTIGQFVGEMPQMSNKDARKRISDADGVITDEISFNEVFRA